MCGIVGFIRTSGSFASGLGFALKDAIYFQRLRGIDALGMFKVDADSGKLVSDKEVGEPYGKIVSSTFKKYFEASGNARFLVGHNRHATKGGKTEKEAQPFIVEKGNGKGSIAFVHNGTLSHINEPYFSDFPGYTDSHQIAKMIAAEVPLNEISGALWGSFATVWYDSEDESLHFWRNKERPFGFVQTQEAIWFGSEIYAVAAALERNNIEVQVLKRFEANEHWTWHPEWGKKTLDHFQKEQVVAQAPTKKSSSNDGNNVSSDDEEINNILDDLCTDCDTIPFSFGGKEGTRKSTSNGAANRTAVVPFREGTIFATDLISGLSVPVGVVPIQIPKYARAWDHANKGKPQKTRYITLDAAIGFARGDLCYFSLHRHTATSRVNQVVIEGHLVTFETKGGEERRSMQMNVKVHGMMGKDIKEVDANDKIFVGIITKVEMGGTTANGTIQYRFLVRDIKFSQVEDEFLEFNLLRPRREEKLVQVETKSETDLSNGVVLPHEKPIVSGNFMRCGDCGNHFAPEWMRKVQQSDEESSIVIRLCSQCYTTSIMDDTRLQRLFQNAAHHMHEESCYQPYEVKTVH